VQAAKLDVLIICGDDQHELFNDDLMPPLAVYYGETIRNPARTPVPADAWYKQAQMRRMEDKQDAHYPCHPALALHLIHGLVEREFDVTSMKAMRKEQYEGHAFSFMHRFYLAEGMVPIVPIMLFNAKLSQDIARDLFAEGVYVIGFFFPVVAAGQARGC